MAFHERPHRAADGCKDQRLHLVKNGGTTDSGNKYTNTECYTNTFIYKPTDMQIQEAGRASMLPWDYDHLCFHSSDQCLIKVIFMTCARSEGTK